MSDYSTFLFTMPSGVVGAGSVVDLGGQLNHYNRSTDGAAADLRALIADSCAVVADLKSALPELITSDD